MTATITANDFTSLLDDSYVFERLTKKDYPEFVTKTIKLVSSNSGLKLRFAQEVTGSHFNPETKTVSIPAPPPFPSSPTAKEQEKFFTKLAEWRGVLNHEVGHAMYTLWRAKEKDDIEKMYYHQKHHAFVDLFENGRMERVVAEEFPGMKPDLMKLETLLGQEIKKIEKADPNFNHLYYAMRMAINGYDPVTEIPEKLNKDWEKCQEFIKEAWETDNEQETIAIAKKVQKYIEKRYKEELEKAKAKKKEKKEKKEKLEKIKMKMEDLEQPSMPNLSDDMDDMEEVEVEIEGAPDKPEDNEDGQEDENGASSDQEGDSEDENSDNASEGAGNDSDEDFDEEESEDKGKGTKGDSSTDSEDEKENEESDGGEGEEDSEDKENEDSEDKDGEADSETGETAEEKAERERQAEELKKEAEQLEKEIEDLEKEEEEDRDTAEELDTKEVKNIDPTSVFDKTTERRKRMSWRSRITEEVVPLPFDDYVKNIEVIPEGPSEETQTTLNNVMGQIAGMAQRFIQKVRSSVHVGVRTYRGRVSSRNLHKYRTSKNIFKTENKRQKKDASVMIVVDCSGSMSGGKIETALKSALVMGEIMSRAKVEFEVVGFSVGSASYDFSAFTRTADLIHYRFANDKNWNTRKHGILHAHRDPKVQLMDNDDGESLRQFAHELRKSKKDTKMMVVISDGEPATNANHGNVEQDLHVAIREIRESGIGMYAVGLNTNVGKFYGEDKSVRLSASCDTKELIEAMAKFIGLIV
jgi:cobalamin biosynthesis protein CobT